MNYLFVGGSTGIGAELTKRTLSKGNKVTLISRSKGSLTEDDNLNHITGDITDKDFEFPKINEPLDGLVYFPGTINLKPFRGLKPEAFREDMEINLIGFVSAMQAYLSNLKKSGNASVIAFSTVAVQTGMPFHTSVASAKGAVEGFVRSLAAELAPKVRVNAIAPSLTDTPLGENLLNTESKQENAKARHPLARYGKPEDIAAMAEFLL
ncbi:MAG TPA: SDR family oxidoreductase, partial [Bacteroidales bacterium]|nr:SDR family oxidoreductase [Bacteroidales bacterium]